jgi:predicted O-linked N-acetylglucosamine transferase (SPINDLY family)
MTSNLSILKNRCTLKNEKVIEKQELLEAFRLHSSGNWAKAEILYQKIIGADPRHPDTLHILGSLAFCLDADRIATDMLIQAIQLNSNRSHYYGTLGDVYKKQGMLDKAIRCYQKALQLDPMIPEILISLGSVYHLKNRVDDAIDCYQRALKLMPDSVRAMVSLGTIYKELGQIKDAESLYSKSLRLASNVGVEIKSALLLPVICESIESIQHYRMKISRQIKQIMRRTIHLDDPYLQVGTTSFHLAYHGVSNKDIQQQIASLYLKACSNLSWVNPACYHKRRKGGKIAVGIISQFLHRHTIGYLNYGIIKNINRDKFHVTVFRFGGKDDKLSEAINKAADVVIHLPARLEKARRMIAEQVPDILFYPDIGMDSLTYFLAFARLAPVQCTTWGHADTTGIPSMDYYLSSVHAEPHQAQQHYTERLVLLNKFPMYCQYPKLSDEMVTREKFGLPTNCHLYMCCQSLFKFHPDFDEIIAAILQRDPNGILLLFEGKYASWGELLRKRFAWTLPQVIDRVHFQPRVAAEDFLSIISLADVMIDTIHFSGGYTSLLCLACGIPVVTLPGAFMRGRMTYALYKQMGIFDCVAADIQSFVDIAYALATNKAWRHEISKKIKDHAPALFEDIETVNELERFFEWAVRRAEKAPSSVGFVSSSDMLTSGSAGG